MAVSEYKTWEVKFRTKEYSGAQNASVRSETIVADTPEEVLSILHELIGKKILVLDSLHPAKSVLIRTGVED